MEDTGYTTRDVTTLSPAELVEEALQSADTAGYCAGKYPHSLQFREARDRRDACFGELKRRLEAYAQLAYECRKLMDYRKHNTLNFQLVKADDYFRLIGLALDELRATDGDS